ncbi:unnamed protein product, partial [marine sediment metagenome]
MLILKYALEMGEEEYSTNDSSLEESSVAKKIIRLFHKLSPMREGV